MLPKSFAIYHIKGRQDESMLYKDLSIKACLDIDTEKIATSYSFIHLDYHISSKKLLYTSTTNAHIIESIIRFELINMSNRQKTSYAGSTLAIQHH